MTFQVSAGVNVLEIDLTNIIPAVSTTEGAIVGHFRWGPVQKRVLIDSEPNLASQFGTPNANTANDFFPAANVLGYGNKLVVVRVVNANTSGGNLGASHARNAITASANSKNTVVKNSDDYELNFSSGISGVGPWVAKYPGELGNSLKVSICQTANAWQSVLTGTLEFTNNSVTVTGTGTQFTNQVTVGDILLAGPDKRSVKVSAIGNTTSLTLSSAYVGNTATGQTTTRRWEFFGNFDGAPGTSAYATNVGGSNDEMHIAVIDEDGQFTGITNNVIEKYERVSKARDARGTDGSGNYYKNIINERSRFVWWAATPTGITNAGVNAVGVNFGVGSQSQPSSVSFVNGRDGALPQEAQYTVGADKFANPEDVDISFLIVGEANQTRALHVINNIAESRKDCLAVLSVRRTDAVNNSGYVNKEADDMVTFRDLLPSTSYAVLDSGFKYQYDKYNDVYRYVSCSGDTAGLMIRTDLNRDPWYSPAGFNRGQIKNAIKLAYNPSKAARDVLYKKGINPIVTFPGEGTILYGDKTLLAKPSAFDRINVRRLFIVLEKSISIAAKYLLFEINDEFTRASFRNMTEPFLRDVQARRGIYDFRVICDGSNNTPEVIDRNEFVGSILVKPARSINFIQLNFVAVRTGVAFEEIEGAF